ncbi:MBL fold metallo-hydrolase [Comamonas composti]|uniref:MBL fold metallo-hydrolase n=1 Tax=Comamonas composti TaxID=408558 RepID=UPI00040E73DD|nr:MBL fold metallo-hydrolase [Comamonas composti]
MAKITVFEAGWCTHVACVALKGAGLASCRFPSRAYLIETARGRWLWDTGYAQRFLDSTRSGLFAWYRRITPVHFDASAALVLQLREKGLRPGDLNAVMLSHFHGDHIAGLKDFAGVPTWLSGAGWNETRSLRGLAALRQGFIPDLIPAGFESSLLAMESFETIELASSLAPFARGYLAPGADGEIVLVHLPGHAAGHMGAFVNTDEGWVLLAADAAWSPRSYEELVGPSRLAHVIMQDSGAYYRTLQDLHQLHKAGGARICLTHEGAL